MHHNGNLSVIPIAESDTDTGCLERMPQSGCTQRGQVPIITQAVHCSNCLKTPHIITLKIEYHTHGITTSMNFKTCIQVCEIYCDELLGTLLNETYFNRQRYNSPQIIW